jgi:undecaprenyl-diphosphatase
MLAIPTILGATVVELHHAPTLAKSDWLLIIVGTIVSFVVALLTMKWALRLTTKKPLRYFGWYRIAVGIVLVVVLLT